MSAAFWKNLVFNVQRSCASAFVFHNGSHATFHFAVASVGVGNHGQAAGVRNFANRSAHFRQRDEPNIWKASHIRRGTARYINRFKTSVFYSFCNKSVKRAWRHDNPFVHQCAQYGALVLRRDFGVLGMIRMRLIVLWCAHCVLHFFITENNFIFTLCVLCALLRQLFKLVRSLGCAPNLFSSAVKSSIPNCNFLWRHRHFTSGVRRALLSAFACLARCPAVPLRG